MKDTSWRTGNLRIKSKTLARTLSQLVIAKEVKPNNAKLLSLISRKKKETNFLGSRERNGVQMKTQILFFFSVFQLRWLIDIKVE